MLGRIPSLLPHPSKKTYKLDSTRLPYTKPLVCLKSRTSILTLTFLSAHCEKRKSAPKRSALEIPRWRTQNDLKFECGPMDTFHTQRPPSCLRKLISGRCATAEVLTVHCRNESTAPISKCTVGIMKCTRCKCTYVSARFQTQHLTLYRFAIKIKILQGLAGWAQRRPDNDGALGCCAGWQRCGWTWATPGWIRSVCGDSWFILGAMIAHDCSSVQPHPAPETNQSDSGQVRL